MLSLEMVNLVEGGKNVLQNGSNERWTTNQHCLNFQYVQAKADLASGTLEHLVKKDGGHQIRQCPM